MKKNYVGHLPDGRLERFLSDVTPTLASHGHLYGAVIGPFRTARAARWAEKYGRDNPHFQCVRDAERLCRCA